MLHPHCTCQSCHLVEIKDLSPAEEKLLESCATPERITVGDGELPKEAAEDCVIRAKVLRYILLGEGKVRLDGKGLRLRGAWIKGALGLQGCDCTRDISPKEGTLTDAFFGATEEHGRDMAVSLARAKVGGILFFQDNQITRGIVNLAGANVARLKDEPVGPEANYPIRLDGFRYTDFSRHADTSIKARLEWLERRPDNMEFTAQPYEQLANVLDTLGHRNDARTVLMHKERHLRRENRKAQSNIFLRGLAEISDPVLRFTIGYGYRSSGAVMFALQMIVGLGFFFRATWSAGDMTPNSVPIIVSQNWISATQTHPDNLAEFWSGMGQEGQVWETFSGFAYAADLVIPIVNLGQENAWAPSTSRDPLGRMGWWLRWVAKGLG